MSKPEFVYVTYIETTPEKLWQALTSRDILTAVLRLDRSAIRTGRSARPLPWSRAAKTTDVGEILGADPPQRLSYTFNHVLNDGMRQEQASKVVFILEPYGDLVKPMPSPTRDLQTASCWLRPELGGLPSSPISRACWNPGRRW